MHVRGAGKSIDEGMCVTPRLELQSTSGLGVRPARVSARQCSTTRAQYASVSGTTCRGTPASRQTCAWGMQVVQGKKFPSASTIHTYKWVQLGMPLHQQCAALAL